MPDIYHKFCKPYVLPWTSQSSSQLSVKDSFALISNKNDAENSFIIFDRFFGKGFVSFAFNVSSGLVNFPFTPFWFFKCSP